MTNDKRLRIYLSGGLIVLLAAALRFYRLDAQSLWSDEGNSLALAQAGFAEIAARTAFDIHPPFYYWLLKIWLALFGVSEFAARSLSATLGILLVALVYKLGARLFTRKVGLAAALAAAISPFQVYYAQEARMYILLALLGAICVLLAAEILTAGRRPIRQAQGRPPTAVALAFSLAYVIAATLGLYTHYAFPVILAAINLAALAILWSRKRELWRWLGLQFIPLILYLPWLPTAFRQITIWPALTEEAALSQILLTVLQTLSLGISAPAVNNLWLIPFIAIAILGITTATRRPVLSLPNGPAASGRQSFILHSFGKLRTGSSSFILHLWLLLPISLTLVLFRPAYLKFLLVADPPFRLFLALGIVGFGFGNRALRQTIPAVLFAFIAVPSAMSLHAYYTNPAYHRDNYRGIAAYIESVAAEADAIILHAPGQQEVFGYYYQPGPNKAAVFPLPAQRPLDPDQTIAALETIVGGAERVYAVYWATEEADPEGLIENWLAQNAFKADDVWFGNIRLVSYAAPDTAMIFEPADFLLGEQIKLTGYSLSKKSVGPGEILQLGLTWQTSAAPPEDYTIFAQLLDSANHVAAQQDAFPIIPSTAWPPGETVADQFGLLIEPGTPPGSHRLIVGLYNATTGARLPVDGGQDYLDLGAVEIKQNQPPLPPEAFNMMHPLNNNVLLGYDLYKLGHASTPETPLYPGDPLHLNLYWQKGDDRPLAAMVTLRLLSEQGREITAWERPIAGVDYPAANWLENQIVRAQFDLFLSNILPGRYRLGIVLGDEVVGLTDVFVVEN